MAGFVVGSPIFPKATVQLSGDKTLTITGADAAKDAPYVQSLNANGQSISGPWIPWSAISNGGTLDFKLGTKPSQWGKDPKDGPPTF